MFLEYCQNVLVLGIFFRKFSECFYDVFDIFQDVLRMFSGCSQVVLMLFSECSRDIRGIFQDVLRIFSGSFRNFSECFYDVLRVLSACYQNVLRKFSLRMFSGSFQVVLKCSQNGFMVVHRIFHDVFRMFLGCSQGVLKMFSRSFQNVLKMFSMLSECSRDVMLFSLSMSFCSRADRRGRSSHAVPRRHVTPLQSAQHHINVMLLK